MGHDLQRSLHLEVGLIQIVGLAFQHGELLGGVGGVDVSGTDLFGGRVDSERSLDKLPCLPRISVAMNRDCQVAEACGGRVVIATCLSLANGKSLPKKRLGLGEAVASGEIGTCGINEL